MADPVKEGTVRVERSPKRLRAFLGGHLVLATLQARLVWEVPYYPHYYVPREDVRAKLLATGNRKPSRQRGDGVLWTVAIDGHHADAAAATFDDSPVTELRGLVRVKWDAMDSWFEEDEEVFTHARSPYTRVDILPTSRHIRVESRGVTVAETTKGHVLFETGLPSRFYVPKLDVRMDLLEPTDTVTYCPYKGRAAYWTFALDDWSVEDAAWSYQYPLPECTRIAGLLCFDSRKVDVVVDGIRRE